MAGQAVGAQQQQVTWRQIDLEQVDRRPALRADAVEDDVLVGIDGGLGRSQGAFFHEAGDEALIARHLYQRAAAQQIGAAIAYVADVGAALLDDSGHHRRGHPAAVVALGRQLAQVGIGRLHRFD